MKVAEVLKTLQTKTVDMDASFTALDTFETDSNNDSSSSSKRLESREMCYVPERNRTEQTEQRGRKGGRKQRTSHHLQSVQSKSVHYQKQIASSHFVVPKKPRTKEKPKDEKRTRPTKYAFENPHIIYTTSNRPFRCLAIRAHSSLSTSSR